MNTTFNAARHNNPKFELLKPGLPSLEDVQMCLVLRQLLQLWFEKNCFIKSTLKIGLEKYMFG